ncbi:MAG: hypothetical protein CXT71_00810 [Methanobacteriota archaeon]|jgi:hypothetical protein|nr:MAG: hypothetical protein CXT71_00810 [Euryarchaeota archaeon]
MNQNSQRADWSVSTMSWYAILIWFSASLFSQVAHMAIYGIPYDANLMLASLGPYAWIMIGIELLIWGVIALSFVVKVAKRFGIELTKPPSSENALPHN